MQSQQNKDEREDDGDKSPDYISRSEFKECMRELSEHLTRDICSEIKRRESAPPCRTPATSSVDAEMKAHESASPCRTPAQSHFEAELRAIERQEIRAQRQSMSSMDTGAEGYGGAMSYYRRWNEHDPKDYMGAIPSEGSRHIGTRPKESDHGMTFSSMNKGAEDYRGAMAYDRRWKEDDPSDYMGTREES
ncbi:MAG: hypothetical protein ABW185_13945, partial [Sedimenticola sp.]